MARSIFSCKIDYDTRIEEEPEYHLAVECCDEAFEFAMNGQLLELIVPQSGNRNHGELMPSYLTVRSKFPITLTDAKALHSKLIQWKVIFRDWYQVLAYASTQTLVIQPNNSLWAQTRLPNNRFEGNGSVTKLTPKPYRPKQWHIWPAKPVGRVKMSEIIGLSSSFRDMPIHYQLLIKAIKSFNDEYFDLRKV